MNSPLKPDVKQKCEARLNELSKEDLLNLTDFAGFRLLGVGRSSDGGEDLAQSALLAVVKGLELDKLGRRPRPEDIANKQLFIKYLKGVIISLLQNQTKTREIKAYHRHTPVADASGLDEFEGGIILAAETPTASQQAEWNDRQNQLFSRLRARAPQRLWRTIDAWEDVFQDSDRIPVKSFRKYVVELRNLAREVFKEMGGN